MISWTRQVAVLAGALAVQAIGGPLWELRGVIPHFVLLVVLRIGLESARWRVAVVATAAGLVLDAWSIDPFGASALALPIAGLIAAHGARRGWADDFGPRAVLVGVAVVAAFVVHSLVVRLLEAGWAPLDPEMRACAYTLALAAPVAVVADRWLLGPSREREPSPFSRAL